MYKQVKSKKIRKLILRIAPNYLVRRNLEQKIFEQILSDVKFFKAFPVEFSDDAAEQQDANGRIYFIELRSPDKEKQVVSIVEKFHFEVLSQ